MVVEHFEQTELEQRQRIIVFDSHHDYFNNFVFILLEQSIHDANDFERQSLRTAFSNMMLNSFNVIFEHSGE